MKKNFLFAMIAVLLICSTAFAGPFGIFGNRSSSSNCPGGNCQIQKSSSYTQSVQKYSLTGPVTALPQAPAIVATVPATPVLVKEVEVMPKTLTINGVLYTRH